MTAFFIPPLLFFKAESITKTSTFAKVQGTAGRRSKDICYQLSLQPPPDYHNAID